jgi:hypothetical protein
VDPEEVVSIAGPICLFVVDPGSHTGVAQGRFWEEGSFADRIASRMFFETYTIEGTDLEQVRILWRMWQLFQQSCRKARLPYELVFEDFILTRLKSSDRAGLSPVRITSMFRGYRHGLTDGYESAGFGPTRMVEPIYQQPSDAFSFATDDRLREWGLWLPGAAKEHEREATAHLCLRLSKRMRLRGTGTRQSSSRDLHSPSN